VENDLCFNEDPHCYSCVSSINLVLAEDYDMNLLFEQQGLQ
jgi:hypothetical protein